MTRISSLPLPGRTWFSKSMVANFKTVLSTEPTRNSNGIMWNIYNSALICLIRASFEIAWESLIMQSAYSNPTQSGGTHMLLVMPRYTANWGGLCEDQKQHMRKASVTMNGICASSGVNAHVYLPDEIEGVAQPMFKIFHRQVHQIFILGDYQVYVP